MEAANAFVERRATAVRETVHEFFEAAGAGDDLLHFEDFARGEFLPAGADGSRFVDTA